jgi:hypothetical protein
VVKPTAPSVGPPGPVGAIAPSGRTERLRGDPRLLVATEAAPSQRPGFQVGEAVSARLVEALPNRQWLAIVKDTPLTLQFPSAATGAQAAKGQTLALQVATTTPRLAFLLADAAPPAPAHGAVALQLSDAARTLIELVQAGTRGTAPSGPPLLELAHLQPGQGAATPEARAQAVAQAISHSGLFYESHLLAWSEGRLPLERLEREPQARIAAANAATGSPAALETDHAELGNLLQRQLDALDGKPLSFSGEAWPGQPAEWRIRREPDERHDAQAEPRSADAESAPAWSTDLQLDLPRLGALGATVRVSGAQVTLALALASDAAAAVLATHRDRLASALQAAGLTLAGLSIRTAPPPDERLEEA